MATVIDAKWLQGVLAAATLALGLSGCVISVNDGDWDADNTPWSKIEKQNRQQLELVEVGMTQRQVFSIMGTADFNEMVQTDAGAIQVLYFRTQHRSSDGETSKDECTPLVLKDGKVAGWGDVALSSAINKL
ncbi:DUF3192 domain-containing protein [Ferrimonas senticii]|uniref:DUF3192 domain-containing protein n=1 Tax=Ferrimonas senticii TaxID=394566 RepID=UPI000406E2BE|nr:DUF3192 domain-containing protein [Ferrimonas senticii]